MIDVDFWKTVIVVAGIGQITLALGSLAIPGVLNWKEDVAKLKPLTRQIFWTYASYILMANFSFGLLSLCVPGDLLNGSTLAACVTGFIAFYWLTRLVFQFGYFDRTGMPQGRLYTLGEFLLVTGFVYFLVSFSVAFYLNIR
jgi:hypothetical protein